MDPWIHRSKNMLCPTCMYFAPKAIEGQAETSVGRCRRHSPTANGYPVVLNNDWCGDHKLNELSVPQESNTKRG